MDINNLLNIEKHGLDSQLMATQLNERLGDLLVEASGGSRTGFINAEDLIDVMAKFNGLVFWNMAEAAIATQSSADEEEEMKILARLSSRYDHQTRLALEFAVMQVISACVERAGDSK